MSEFIENNNQSESLKSKTIKGVIWKGANTMTNLLVNFVVGIILARMLMPEDYGAVAMIAVFTSVLGLFTDGGLTAALIRKENRTETDKCTIFYYNFVATYLVYAIIYFGAPYISEFYNMPILCRLARISSIGLLISPFASMQELHFTIDLDFKTPAIIGFICNLVSAVLSITMAYCGYGVWALAIPGIFVTLLKVIVTIAIVRWKPTRLFSWASFKELFAFSSNLLISMVMDRVYNNITPLVVGKFFSPAQLGLYGRAQSWPSLPSSTLTEVLQGVTFPIMSKMQNDIMRLTTNYRRLLKFYSFIVFPLMFGLAAIAKPLTIVLITEKWIDSVPLMQLLCFSLMWYPIHALSNNLLHVTGRSDYFLRCEFLHKGAALILMACSLPFGLEAFCAMSILISMVSVSIVTSYTKRITGFGFVGILKDISMIIFNCSIMAVLCLLVQMPFNNYVVQLCISVPIAIAYYCISARYFNKEQYKEAMDIVASRFPQLNRYRINI